MIQQFADWLVYSLIGLDGTTGLPVVIVAWIIAYSIGNIAGFYKKMQVFQKWLNRMVAVLFIIVGISYAYTFYL